MTPHRKRSRKRGIWALVVAFVAWLLKQLRQLEVPHLELTIALSLTVVILVANPLESNESPAEPPSEEPGIFPQDPGSPWEVDTATTYDVDGRKLHVAMGTMDVNHRWLLGSTSFIGIDGKETIPVEQIFSRLKRDTGRPIVVLGMSSHENAAENPAQENDRAQIRAERLGRLAVEYLQPQPEVRFVNLGARLSNFEYNTAEERRVAIMQITCMDPGTDIVSGIRNALRVLHDERGDLPFNPADYSNWNPDRFSALVSAHRIDAPRVPACHPPA